LLGINNIEGAAPVPNNANAAADDNHGDHGGAPVRDLLDDNSGHEVIVEGRKVRFEGDNMLGDYIDDNDDVKIKSNDDHTPKTDEANVQGEINNDIKIKGRGWGRVLVVAALGGGILYGLLKEI
jgi:hypothetical protein